MCDMGTSFKEKDLRFYFIVQDGIDDTENVSDDMNIAYTNILEYITKEDKRVIWISEEDCLKLKKLGKKDVFVLQEFSGRAFEFLKKTKSLVIGPRCVINCLLDDLSIPLGNFPVFTTAMRDLYVCTSGLTVPEKKKIENLVSWMGGYYFDSLSLQCTHLVSNTVQSQKYEQAALNNIIIMHPDWINDVWEKSQKENILATNQQFDKHKLPIFYNLNFTSTAINNEKRDQIKKLIEDNGGHYSGSFKSKITDILILEKNGTNSPKYKAALDCKKDCLLPDWVIDSVKKGYALPFKHYQVRAIKVSTPTKSGCESAAEFNPDCTELSDITPLRDHKSSYSINETCSSTISSEDSVRQPPQTRRQKQKEKSNYIDILNTISLRDLKKAGTFLDGCRIYLTGFTDEEREKLNKIVNSGGAIRYEELNENLTHIIVGASPNEAELKSARSQTNLIGIVTLSWLLESLKLRQPAEENQFIYRTKLSIVTDAEAPSPSSKKTIQSMNHSFKKPAVPPKFSLDTKSKHTKAENKIIEVNTKNNSGDDDDDIDLLEQYKAQNVNYPSDYPKPSTSRQSQAFDALPICPTTTTVTSTILDSENTDFDQYDFFEGFAIYVHEPNDEDLRNEIIMLCEKTGGKVVSNLYKQTVDYIIVSSEEAIDLNEIPVKGKVIVNTLWLEDAIAKNELIEKQYFHEYIPMTANKKPLVLEGLTIVISTYTANERVFLQSLIKVLGANMNEIYVRKEHAILICPESEGTKYAAAIKWGYPAVKSEWLVECAKQGEFVNLRHYLVGDAIVSENWEQSILDKKSLDENDDSTLSRKEKEIENHDQMQTPDNNIILRHPRLSEIAKQHQQQNVSSSKDASSSDNPLNLTDLCQQFSTPNRQLIYDVCKEMQNQDTPLTQRARKLVETPDKAKKISPKFPEFCTTPEMRKRRIDFFSKYHVPKKEKRTSTPLSEIRKKFWQKALGEHYWEPPENSQQIETKDDNLMPGPSTAVSKQPTIPLTDGPEQSENVAIANENMKRLSDFIKNREIEDNKPHRNENEDDNLAILQKFDSEMGGTEQLVGWDDPSNRPNRRNVNVMRYKGIPKFSISCTIDAKQDIIDKIIELKGTVCENLINYDQTCTHIVCEKPNRGEKILSCIAAGKWLLSLKYIEDSYRAGVFLDEEEYEWGNPKALNLPTLQPQENTIASAAFRWRTKIANSGSLGAFKDFRVILHLPKIESFERLIKAGGGQVIHVQPPYREKHQAFKATHCLVDTKIKLPLEDYRALKNANVLILTISYLNMYLTSEISLDPSKFEINF